jgi:hypothetical protein
VLVNESNDLPISDGIRAALALLKRAHDCARETQVPPWDFALEIGQLYAAGLTITDLRWMVVREFVEHADETSAYGDERRSFTPGRGLNFLPTTCVFLTIRGAAFAANESALKPHWDAALRELSPGGRLVKQFHVPAKNQELILSAFQNRDWPKSIVDPLADEFDADPKTRLNDAVYRLNHKQLACLIRFHVNGQGTGLHWALREPTTTCS